MSLSAEAISLRLGGRLVLDRVSATVSAGEVHALVGPNGAGKSTLLRMMSGEDKPEHGEVGIDGQPLDRFHARDLALRRSVMVQSAAIAFDFFVEEVLAMGWLGGAARTASEQVVASKAVAHACRVNHLLGRKFRTLSGGERQRVHFARALLQIWRPKPLKQDEAGESRYMLLDEPTSSLDLGHEGLVLRLARRAADNGVGVLVVLHDLDLAARYADQLTLLVDGTVWAQGPARDVLTPGALSRAYGTPVEVEWIDRLDRLVVCAV